MSTHWEFTDVFDLSADGLQSVPRPVAAALFLYPVSLSLQVGSLAPVWDGLVQWAVGVLVSSGTVSY